MERRGVIFYILRIPHPLLLMCYAARCIFSFSFSFSIVSCPIVSPKSESEKQERMRMMGVGRGEIGHRMVSMCPAPGKESAGICVMSQALEFTKVEGVKRRTETTQNEENS